MFRRFFKLDILGFILSFACALHCTLVPIILMFGAFSSLHFLTNPFIEHAVIASAIVIAGCSLIPQYFRHKKKEAIISATAGFLFIIIGHVVGMVWVHSGLVIIGGLLVAFSHLLNFQYIKQISTCQQ